MPDAPSKILEVVLDDVHYKHAKEPGAPYPGSPLGLALRYKGYCYKHDYRFSAGDCVELVLRYDGDDDVHGGGELWFSYFSTEMYDRFVSDFWVRYPKAKTAVVFDIPLYTSDGQWGISAAGDKARLRRPVAVLR